MNLSEQANDALNALLDSEQQVFTMTQRRIARQLWLLGFEAGMNATHALAEDAFAMLEADLSWPASSSLPLYRTKA